MAWSSPDSWLTRLFSGDPLTILIAFLVTISLPILLHFYFYTTSARVSLIPTFLILGPSGAGKTSLVSLLQRRSIDLETTDVSPTRTSQIPYTVDLKLPPSIPLGSNKYRSKNDMSLQETRKTGTKYRIIDTPGHGKLRLEQSLSQLQDPSLRGIIYLVDATTLDISNSSTSRDTAEYLHDILRAFQARKASKSGTKQNIPILVAANKQDLFTALPPGAVKDRLQIEIEKVRISRHRGLGTVGQDTEEDENDILGGRDDSKFTFKSMEEDYNIIIDVLGGAIRGGEEEPGKGVKRWEEWIGECL